MSQTAENCGNSDCEPLKKTHAKQLKIAIATLSDWLKKFAPVFQPMRSKTKTNRTMYAWFSRASSELQVTASNCDWFIALFVSVVIGRSNCFGFGFSTVIWKPKTALLHNDWNTTACHDTTSFLGSLFFPCPDPGNEVGHDKPLKLFKHSIDHSVHVNVFRVAFWYFQTKSKINWNWNWNWVLFCKQ